MRFRFITTLLLAAAFAPSGFAQGIITEGVFRMLERAVAAGDDVENSDSWTVSAAGAAGSALLLANGTNLERGQRPFFCQNPDMNFRPKDFGRIALEHYRGNPGGYRQVPAQVALPVAVFNGLQARYPCR